MTIGLFSLTIYVALDLYIGKRNADQSIKELESQNLKAQVAALTAQMNPHLLFNSLNSIASMIHDQPELAESMTVELSNLYRRVLQAVKHDKHSLAAELDLCRSYLEIERARFDERLKYVVVVDDAVDAGQTQIPVLCVQPFVENAVKHGLLAKVEGGTLRLGATVQGGRLVITVEDDGVGIGRAPRSQGSGTAIQNCRERLGILFGAEASLTIDGLSPGTRVTIQMPLVSMQEGKA
jgi:sensor histidine kinase YesM